MSAHKSIDKICIVAITVTIIISLLFCNGQAFGIQKTAHAIGYENRLFDRSKVHKIDIVMDDWDGFIEKCESEEYSRCDLVIDGEASKNVGIRAKGNTSLSSVKNMDSDRYSFKVEFDQYDSTKSYHGLDKLCLNNIIQDNTYIVVRKPKIPQEEIEDVKRRLREYTDRVNNGDSFTMLARLYSEDPGSAMSGGDLGRFMGRGELDPAFANVAFNLQTPDKISKVVESEFGYHIIQLIEKRGDRIRVRHILLKPHVPEEALTESRAFLDSIADEVRNGKFTFEEAAYAFSDDKNTRNNGGLLPNENTQTSRFEMQDLPSEIAKVVDTMEVGEISKAINMTPRTGQEQTVIVKLKSRVKGHKATVSDDYQRLKEMVVQKKQDELIEKWIQNKLKSTYVRISDNWKPSCDFKYKGWIK